jgi:hypothetical protein
MINNDIAVEIAQNEYHKKYNDTEGTVFSTMYVNQMVDVDYVVVGLLARKEGDDLKVFTIDIPMWHYNEQVQKKREQRIDEIL